MRVVNHFPHWHGHEDGEEKRHMFKIAARVLATYLIPGCVGREVRLGSENSSGAGGAGNVWKSGKLEICEPGNLGIWRSGDLEIQTFEVQKIKKEKLSKFNVMLPKTLARSRLVGKNPPGPIWGHLRQFFPGTGKFKK